jgi:pilus assembly protein FimV
MLAPGFGDNETVDAPVDDDETMLAGPDEEDDFDFAKTEALPIDVFTSDANPDMAGELPAVASTDFDLDLDDLTAALKVSEMGDTVDQPRDDATVEQPRPNVSVSADETAGTLELTPGDLSEDLHDARTMTEVGTKLDLARAYVDMGDPAGARSILEEVLDEGDGGQRQQAQQLLDSLP